MPSHSPDPQGRGHRCWHAARDWAAAGAVSGKGMVAAMKAKARYTAKFERGEKYWVVQLKELPACISQARTIEQGKERIRAALGLFIGDAAEKVELVVEAALPAPVRKAVERS